MSIVSGGFGVWARHGAIGREIRGMVERSVVHIWRSWVDRPNAPGFGSGLSGGRTGHGWEWPDLLCESSRLGHASRDWRQIQSLAADLRPSGFHRPIGFLLQVRLERLLAVRLNLGVGVKRVSIRLTFHGFIEVTVSAPSITRPCWVSSAMSASRNWAAIAVWMSLANPSWSDPTRLMTDWTPVSMHSRQVGHRPLNKLVGLYPYSRSHHGPEAQG
jgi:hypothetical protein